MILVVDNYDSFVHNLARHLRLVGCETKVVRNDEVTLQDIRSLQPTAIVLSPGPCTPVESPICMELVNSFGGIIPILGICLGHQAIVQALGGKIVQAKKPIHGRSSLVYHQSSKMFNQVANPFQVGRYHSLVVESSSLPNSLQVTAQTQSGTIMAVEHSSDRLVGLQFHPESILTESGMQLLRNFCIEYASMKEAITE